MIIRMDTIERAEEHILDNADHAATGQIDWNSFVNLEYDPAIPPAATVGHPATNDSHLQKPSDCASTRNLDDPSLILEGSASFAALEFPSMDQWWAELPNDIQSKEWVSSTEVTVSSGNTPCTDSNSSTNADWQSPGLDGEGGDRKRRRRMPLEAKRVLTDCFERHKEDPYIPKEEVQKLAIETGLSLRQVQTFFANARARKLPRPTVGSKPVDILASENQQGPMERFLSSSPEDEGIPEDAVRAAANIMQRPIKPLRSRKGGTPSVRSSSLSSTSNSSSASMDSLDSRGSRKGRKRQREPSHDVTKSIFRRPSSPSRKHQCTFCTLDFEQKYDWKRHEESVHFPQKEWVCMPNGPLEESRCVFCDLKHADYQHLKLHKSTACSEGPCEQRTFQRKDKLAQHIKQVHGCQPPKRIKDWSRPIERKVLLLCGFCSLPLPDWKTRADHISSHFTSGIAMTMWLSGLIGGIWPDEDFTQNFIEDRFSATSHPEGHITCSACPARFTYPQNLTLHRRQAHNVYLPTDSKVVMSKITAGHQSQRLISLAQQTSRIQIARIDGLSGSATPQNVHPQSQIITQPDYAAVFTRSGDGSHNPTGGNMGPCINRPLDDKEHRGFSSAPHSVWSRVLNQNAIASPRVPVRRPLNPLSTTPKSAALRSSLRPVDRVNRSVSHVESTLHQIGSNTVVPSAGPPVEAIRAILTGNREDVGNMSIPAQGMLHSLEQFGGTSAPWPRPSDASCRRGYE